MKSSELRKLVRMFNKRTKITIPKGLKGQADMVKFLSKHGKIDHEGKSFFPSISTTGNQLKLSDYDKMFPPKTTEQKAEAKQKATTRKESSEANMVKSLQGKGYTVTKGATPAKTAPTPAPKKASAPKKTTLAPIAPAELTNIKKKLKRFVEEMVDDLLKEDVRVAEAVSGIKKGYFQILDKLVPKMSPSLKELDNGWRPYETYIRSEFKKYDKPAKKAPAKKAPAKKAPEKKGDISDSEFMKRPAFKFLLKKKKQYWDSVVKLENERLKGKYTKDTLNDVIDKLDNKIRDETSLQLNTKTKPDDIVFKMGTASNRTEKLIMKELKSQRDEALRLFRIKDKDKGSVVAKKAPAKKAPKATLKELIQELKERGKDKGVDEDGDRIFSDKTHNQIRLILNIYKTLPYKLHKDEELYKLMDNIAGHRGDSEGTWDGFRRELASYAKSKK
tara:strand:- start:4674 stop:6011 length:1338 start_codon:yes stop_codon:yes gene_type:complete